MVDGGFLGIVSVVIVESTIYVYAFVDIELSYEQDHFDLLPTAVGVSRI